MSNRSWDLNPPVRDERATLVQEDQKQPKMKTHKPKPVSVQCRLANYARATWDHHKWFESIKKAEAWVQSMNLRESRKPNYQSAFVTEYRIDPEHSGSEADSSEESPDPTLGMRALLDPK